MTDVTSGGVRDGRVVVPLCPANISDARLSFDNGLERLELRAGERLDALLVAQFAEPLPVVWAADHNVHVEYPLGARLLRRMQPSAVVLSPAMAWSLDVHGGAAYLGADLRRLAVQAVSFHCALARSRLVLGYPSGERTIRLTSVQGLRIERPRGVPVRIEVARCAVNVTLDGQRLAVAGRGLAEESASYASTTDRYRLIASGGVDGLTVTHSTGSLS